MDLRKTKFHDYIFNKRFKNNNYVLPDELPYEHNNPMIYCFFNRKNKQRRKRKSTKPKEPSQQPLPEPIPEPPKATQEIVIPPEDVKVIQDNGHVHEEGELCPKCHPPTIKVIFVKKPQGAPSKLNDINTDKFYLCSEPSKQNVVSVPKSCPCGKQEPSAYAQYNPNQSKQSSPSGYDDRRRSDDSIVPNKMGKHDCCIHSGLDSGYGCRCTGPSVPCPGVTNRKKYCACVDPKMSKPVYCADCAAQGGYIPGYGPSYEPVYCDCVDFEDPKLEGLVFPHGRGRGGLCEECAKEEDLNRPQQTDIKNEFPEETPLKNGSVIPDVEKTRKSRGVSPESIKNNKRKKNKNKSKTPKKSRTKSKSDDPSKNGGSSFCRRGLLKFINRNDK